MEAILFIPLVIIAITQIVKMAVPKISGWLTIAVAMAVGILSAVLAKPLGLGSMTVAQGIVDALGAIGISAAAGKASGGTTGDANRQ